MAIVIYLMHHTNGYIIYNVLLEWYGSETVPPTSNNISVSTQIRA